MSSILRLAALRVLAFVTITAGAAAQDLTSSPANLYEAQAIVTGQGEASRLRGFERCLEDVLVKVSGDPRLIGDPRVAELSEEVEDLIEEFRYRDRMEGIPLHDEQGSRDRPHDLTCVFDQPKLDAALRSLGVDPWTAPRPSVTVFLGVRNNATSFILAEDGEEGRTMREAFAAASERTAMPIALPSEAELMEAKLDYASLPAATLEELEEAARSAGGDLALAGSMVFSAEALGWVALWRLAFEGETYRWQVRGVSFDEAFRTALRGAAQILSDNGTPKSVTAQAAPATDR